MQAADEALRRSEEEFSKFTFIDFPGAASTTALGMNPEGDIVGGYAGGHGFLLIR